MPTTECLLTSIGGGLASFALASVLRTAGLAVEDIRVVGPSANPAASFGSLARWSGIADRDRLRSDSAARVDNCWGFPGYAVEEALARRSPAPLARVFSEPVFAEYFTPTSGHVLHGVQVEAERLGWTGMHAAGRALAIRPWEDGFATLVQGPRGAPAVIVSPYVHLGIGYAGLRLSPDLRTYRERTGDLRACVHAYEPHEHVYNAVADAPATVIVRGGGIAASRVVERLLDAADRHRRPVRVVHVVRRPPGARGSHRRQAGAAADAAFDYQTFNFPKGAFGGQIADQVAATNERDRAALVRRFGRTTTASRRGWRRQLRRAAREGRYRVLVGEATGLEAGPAATITMRVADTADTVTSVRADFLIDCTGLTPDARSHPLLADLIDTGLAQPNDLGRIRVNDAFEVPSARQGKGRLYVTGAMALGGPIAAVDSFWGLQAAAIRVCDDLAADGACPRIGIGRSARGWWRWLRQRPP